MIKPKSAFARPKYALAALTDVESMSVANLSVFQLFLVKPEGSKRCMGMGRVRRNYTEGAGCLLLPSALISK